MQKAFKSLFLISLSLLPYFMQAQINIAALTDLAERQGDKSGYAVDKYVLNMEPNIEKPYLKAHVQATLIAVNDGLQDLKMDLANAYKIAKIDGALSFTQKGDVVNIKLPKPLKAGEKTMLDIYYEGQPPLVTSGRITKGLRWETHGEGKERVIANLSTPFLAYLWFPCKDGPNGKTLSGVQVNITVPNVQINGIPLVGVSNGVLKNVVKKDDKIT